MVNPALSYVLTGRTSEHVIVDSRIGVPLHTRVIFPFLSLQKEAQKAGFELRIASAFRDFDRQLLIWNEKCLGKREILSYDGLSSLDFNQLNREELLWALLRWSSIPGTSRHHWGTEIDIYDSNSLNEGSVRSALKLTPAEVSKEGIMGKFHLWLDELLEAKKSFGFFRPYGQDLGGVALEKWHLSYTPQSYLYDESYTYDFFIQQLEHVDLELKDLILKYSEKIFSQYIKNISPYPL